MDLVKQEVLSSISAIDSITMETTLSVYESLSKEYDKMMTIMDYAVENNIDASTFFQEGEILDKATGKYTNDGAIKKIILFIPRLLMAIVQSIIGVFTKDYNKNTDKKSEIANGCLEKHSEEEVVSVAVEIEEQTKGEVKLDPKTKKLSLSKSIKSVWNKGTLLINGAHVLNRLREEIKSPNTNYKKFAEDLKKIFEGEKKFDEKTVAVGVDSFKTGLKDLCAAGYTISSACKELTGILEKKVQSDLEKGADPQKVNDIKDLIDQIQHIAKYTAKTAFAGKIGATVLNIIGNPDLYIPWSKKSKAKARSGLEKIVTKAANKTMHAEDYDEITDLENQINEEGRDIRSMKAKDNTEEKLHKKKMKRRGELADLKEEKDAVEEETTRNRNVRNIENAEYKDSGKVMSKIEHTIRRKITPGKIRR